MCGENDTLKAEQLAEEARDLWLRSNYESKEKYFFFFSVRLCTDLDIIHTWSFAATARRDVLIIHALLLCVTKHPLLGLLSYQRLRRENLAGVPPLRLQTSETRKIES